MMLSVPEFAEELFVLLAPIVLMCQTAVRKCQARPLDCYADFSFLPRCRSQVEWGYTNLKQYPETSPIRLRASLCRVLIIFIDSPPEFRAVCEKPCRTPKWRLCVLDGADRAELRTLLQWQMRKNVILTE